MNLRKYVGVAVGLVLLSVSAHAQETKKPGIGPGHAVVYDVKFDGPDASRIQYVYLHLTLRTPKRPDQSNLPEQLSSTGYGVDANGVFHIAYTIPDAAASGEYEVSISAGIPNNLIQFQYTNVDGLSLPPITIQNDNTIKRPHITVTARP
jgi:hypothetical protein